MLLCNNNDKGSRRTVRDGHWIAEGDPVGLALHQCVQLQRRSQRVWNKDLL